MLMGIELAAQLESCHGQSNLFRSDISLEYTAPNKRDIFKGVFHVTVINSSITTNEVLGLVKDRPKFGAVVLLLAGHWLAIKPGRCRCRASRLSWFLWRHPQREWLRLR